VKLFGIPARYANATYIAASKAGKLDAVEKDLQAFGSIISSNSEFAIYLSNPTISRSTKVSLIESVFDGKKTDQISKNLFTTMAANARLGDARRVIAAYTELMKAKRGEVCTLTCVYLLYDLRL
jgi:ATP synthase F1 delta subunit